MHGPSETPSSEQNTPTAWTACGQQSVTPVQPSSSPPSHATQPSQQQVAPFSDSTPGRPLLHSRTSCGEGCGTGAGAGVSTSTGSRGWPWLAAKYREGRGRGTGGTSVTSRQTGVVRLAQQQKVGGVCHICLMCVFQKPRRVLRCFFPPL